MRWFAVYSLAVAGLLLAGCPGGRGEDESQNAPAQTSTTTANPQSADATNTARMNPTVPTSSDLPSQRVPAAAPPAVDVQLTEYEIHIPDTLPRGETSLKIINAGKTNHNFAIEGNGTNQKLTSDLTRGDSVTLAVDLKPGSYVVYCPVDGHRGRGMQRTITVR